MSDHLVIGFGQRAALVPDTTVERNRFVLHQDEDAATARGHQLTPMYREEPRSSALNGARTRSTMDARGSRSKAAHRVPVAGCEHADVGIGGDLRRGRQQPGQVGETLLDVGFVGSQQSRDGHLRVIDGQLESSAEQALGQLDHRALPQIVCPWLEGQPEESRSGGPPGA